MSLDLIEEHAGALTKEDIIDLFEVLKETYSISKAARECGLTRKTISGWAEADYIKSQTKKKVLNAVIKVQPEKTLEFMLKRFEENAADILYIYFELLYEKAIVEESDKEEFRTIFKRFNDIKREYSGLIFKKLGEEVGDTSQIFREKAISLGIPVPPPSLDEMRPTDLIEIIPDVMRELLSENYRGVTDSRIAKGLNLPIKLVSVLRTIPIPRPSVSYAVRRDMQPPHLTPTSSEAIAIFKILPESLEPPESPQNQWTSLPREIYGPLLDSATTYPSWGQP